ncbi:DUF2478 domain-containing protein [Microbacteriaceae bacterium K1510]|nr:DUF2478 domain-containing protein [Microbacteriaceae bacterium K1510]
MKRSILAFVYSDGLAADRLLADVGYRLRAAGVNVAGLVQRNTVVRGRAKCDMELEELGSGAVVRISEDRGPLAKGCRLDQNVLTQASHLMMGIVAQSPAILIVNKFGKIEAEGGGLRDVIAAAAQSDIPTFAGVPFRNIDQWRAFTGGFADETACEAGVIAWLGERGFHMESDFAQLDQPSARGAAAT